MELDYHRVANVIRTRLYRKCKDNCKDGLYGKGWNKKGLPCWCDQEYNRIYPQIKAGIPMEYINVDTIRKEIREKFKEFKELIGDVNETALEQGIGYCVWAGPYGVGKTTFCTQFLKMCLDAGIEGYYLHIKQFQDAVFMFHDKEAQSYYIDKILDAQVLVIDGLGEEYEMDEARFFPKQLCNFIRLRRNCNKSTSFSTNLSPKSLKSRYKDEFYSLMKNRIIEFELKSKKDLRGSKKDV